MNILWVFSLCCVFCGSRVTAESVATVSPLQPNSSSLVTEIVSATIGNFSAHPATSSLSYTLLTSANHSIYPTLSPSINMTSAINYSVTPIVSSPAISQNVSSLTITVLPTNHSMSQIFPTSSHHIVPTISPSGVNSTAAVMTSTVIPTSSPNVTIISSTAVITSAVMPTSSVVPKPAPPFGNYSLKHNGSACLLASFSVKFDVFYFNKTNGKKVKANIQLPDEQKVTTNGFCEQKSQEGINISFISLTWPAVDPKYNFSITFVTEKHSSGADSEPEESWSAKRLELNINTTENSDFRDAEVQEMTVWTSDSVNHLDAKYGHAVKCHQFTVTGLKNSDETVNATVHFGSLEIQPFGVDLGIFGKADDCYFNPTPKPGSHHKKSSNTVAIAVGCTLAGLVVIVLIGYLIGRRRSGAKMSAGYRKL